MKYQAVRSLVESSDSCESNVSRMALGIYMQSRARSLPIHKITTLANVLQSIEHRVKVYPVYVYIKVFA